MLQTYYGWCNRQWYKRNQLKTKFMNYLWHQTLKSVKIYHFIVRSTCDLVARNTQLSQRFSNSIKIEWGTEHIRIQCHYSKMSNHSLGRLLALRPNEAVREMGRHCLHCFNAFFSHSVTALIISYSHNDFMFSLHLFTATWACRLKSIS